MERDFITFQVFTFYVLFNRGSIPISASHFLA